MSKAARRKFIRRAPRYTLLPSDNSMLRFAQAHEKERTFATQFLDVSLTGVAFVVDRHNAPLIGELIKIEIPLSDEKQIAWWAKVTRIETYSPTKYWLDPDIFANHDVLFVAVTFIDLPKEHILTIHAELLKKFQNVAKLERKKSRTRHLKYILENFWSVLMFTSLTAFLIWFLWFFSLPDARYDEKRGAPWGQRYNFFKIGK